MRKHSEYDQIKKQIAKIEHKKGKPKRKERKAKKKAKGGENNK